MREWIPVPGSAKARLIEAALYEFERTGYEGCNVSDLAAKAGVTTGSLYHHFGSKLGLYTVVRGDMEKRITDRMEGAAAAVTDGIGARAALLVAFDAAVRFDACRLLGEPAPLDTADPVEATIRALLPDHLRVAGVVLAAAWRAALLSVADGAPAESARGALEYVLQE
ncbi:TetR/AcrR family transcriptional regulator [Phytoactinopolyspora halotolerans]|uniref:TetR/AcrR family transcriptional regulator n=1 Tax=Phytoactinopolyspora halotolerans TaxID=1981512 RepID=A0A6L9S3I3_9ACTN|nr:TetR/AcrR family transcriptional regulator [Phytoactinopolyspora halotolerans]NED99984.1 TetR/AcrR family transcriptional regulator [Phytoactinopolyspora halotolerans]